MLERHVRVRGRGRGRDRIGVSVADRVGARDRVTGGVRDWDKVRAGDGVGTGVRVRVRSPAHCVGWPPTDRL